MNRKWFVRKGILFFPASLIGWLISLLAIVYCVYAFIEIDSHSHSASDTLRNFFFRALMTAVVYSAIAYFTSSENQA